MITRFITPTGKVRFKLDRDDEFGKRFKQVFKTEVLAEKKDAEITLACHNPKQRGTAVNPKLTLGEYAAKFVKERYSSSLTNNKQSTIDNMHGSITQHFAKRVGHIKLVEFTRQDARKFIETLLREPNKHGRKMARSTARLQLQRLTTIMSGAVAEGYLVANPLLRLSTECFGKKGKRGLRIRCMDAAQVKTFLTALRAAEPQLFAIFCVMAWAGLRVSEVLHLRVMDVEMVAGKGKGKLNLQLPPWMHFEEGDKGHFKTWSSIRKVDLSPALRSVLASYLIGDGKVSVLRQPEDYLFFPQDAAALYPRPTESRRGMLLARMRRVLKATFGAPLAYFTLHSMRHSFGSIHISTGAPPRWVQEQMGHESLTVTLETYGSHLPATDDAAPARLDHLTAPDGLVGADSGKHLGNDSPAAVSNVLQMT